MPAHMWSRRDSWPPTQLRLRLPRASCARSEPRPLLDDIDENPLTYFLTPVETDKDADALTADDMLQFDAGIRDANRPRGTVRSVSPSTLDGLSKLRARTVSPDLDSDALTTDEDEDEVDGDDYCDDDEDDEDDGEDYVRFSPPTASFLSPFRAVSAGSVRPRIRKSPPLGRPAGGFLTPAASFPAPSSSSSSSPRGRPRQALTRSYSAGSRPAPRARRLWREPSPDVWSISEETEEDLRVEASGDGWRLQDMVAKPKKKVRFVLPAGE
ncbi:uncharacterized protein UV8b_05946 [Ustilaginoidea virens]|uniref:Uncharacterized protein n=1 Tax=Ustilaginoidea virens TaxID=1159556 RepID=A0A8E5HUD6_USTVR|nr:uncharacterized protein UV8b_05946 [Ustilaginoidea virens]QUC21703.1 hypothetical protein UV8b_05946 [Ustilaginoidea virens]